MAGAGELFFENILITYSGMMSRLPAGFANMVMVLLLTFFIVVVAFISWKFYRTLSQRDFINLNLHRYNLAENAVWKKSVAVVFYIIENLFIMPILILFWFALLAIMLLIISEQPEIHRILLVSAALVAAIRILAYSVRTLSEDVAKLFPLIMLSVFLLSPTSISVENLIGQAKNIPLLFQNVFYYFLTVFLIEIVLRCFVTLNAVWKDED